LSGSLTEAEFMALSRATTQALWLSKFFKEIGLSTAKPTIINADNNGAVMPDSHLGKISDYFHLNNNKNNQLEN